MVENESVEYRRICFVYLFIIYLFIRSFIHSVFFLN